VAVPGRMNSALKRVDDVVGFRLTGAAALIAVVIVGLIGTAAAEDRGRGSRSTAIRHFESAEHIIVHSARRPRTASQAPRTSVSFSSLGRQFDLEVESSDLTTPAHRTVWIGDDRENEDVPVDFLYRGHVRGVPHSWVRLSIRNGKLDGMIWTPTETYFVQPEARLLGKPGTDRTVVYRMSDVDPAVLHGACGTSETLDPSAAPAAAHVGSAGTIAAPLFAQALAPAAADTAAPLQEATIGLVADYDYFVKHGANAAADMLSIINQVDGVYQAQLGVDLQVTQTVVYTTMPDPFDTTDPNTLLSEFSTYKGSNDSPVYGTDVAHLFTGRTLDGGVLGLSWIGTLCDSTYSTGLSRDFTTDNTSLVLLAAHEIGHVFGAYHDNQAGSPCASTPFGFIMNPYISSALELQFSGCSLSLIDPDIAKASCLSASIPSDATPTPSPTATASPTEPPPPAATPTPTAAPPATLTPTCSPTRLSIIPTPTRTRTSTPTPLFWRWLPVRTATKTPTSLSTHTGIAPMPTRTCTRTPTPTPVRHGVPVPTPTPWWWYLFRRQ
jgi:hypothetical protein